MRLWHYKLIPFLPKSQLIAQWRELNSIFKKQDNHILINYVYEYDKRELFNYTQLVIYELKKRGIDIRISKQYLIYFTGYISILTTDDIPYLYWSTLFKNHHNNRYLLQCFYNLQEKFDRGQKDFSDLDYEKLYNFVKEEIRGKQEWKK